ncbi:MAG: bacillithiol system redox-active protein YtxJ [Gemmatimonadaceae bacterium]|nr:bacillithiol system redox-active protein YtxJ [Gemmatimonadaceae bacterium]
MSDVDFLAEVTDASFSTEVLESPLPVLVDVWAAWCAPCVTLKPVLARLAESYHGRARVLTLDADHNLETVTRYDVRALPTVLVFHRGALVARQSGAQAYGTYAAQLDAVLRGELDAVAPGAAAAARASTAPVASPAGHDPELEALVSAEQPLVIFKHSATCGVSQSVKRRYDAFVQAHPQVPTRLVVVQQERALSDALEDRLRVRHESPQAIVVQRGQVLWHASHGGITADGLARAVTPTQHVA